MRLSPSELYKFSTATQQLIEKLRDPLDLDIVGSDASLVFRFAAVPVLDDDWEQCEHRSAPPPAGVVVRIAHSPRCTRQLERLSHGS